MLPTRHSLMRMVVTLRTKTVADRGYLSVGSMRRVDALEGGDIPKELLGKIE